MYISIMCNEIMSYFRFALAHEGNKRHRKTLVKYFGEDASAAVAEKECCDVCLGQPEMMNYQEEVLPVIKVVQKIPGYGEQKVCIIKRIME